MATNRHGLLAAAVVLVLAAGSQVQPAMADTQAAGGWNGAWAAAQQWPMPPNEFLGPNWSMEGFANQTVRQTIRVSTGGTLLRVRLSNRYGTAPLRLTGATVGKSAGGAALRPGSLRTLTFDHRTSTTIAAGRDLNSDATVLPTMALETLTVTLYFAAPTGVATFHMGGFTTTYRAAGDHRADPGGAAFGGETTASWYYLTGVDVAGIRARGTVVAFGDSITDGYFSTRNADNRYPDQLAERLVAAGKPLSVLNTGIGGNMVLTDSPCFAGEKAITRFGRDALDRPGVRTVIVLEAINDIGMLGSVGCGDPPPVRTAQEIINGHRILIRAAHARGVKIIGATLTPMKASSYDTERNESVRDAVNNWIRSSGEYDAVVDLDRALADPANPDAMLPAYDGGDHLHPNDAGMTAMAAAVDLTTL
jgi:lysophospholipase L1-like esterase